MLRKFLAFILIFSGSFAQAHGHGANDAHAATDALVTMLDSVINLSKVAEVRQDGTRVWMKVAGEHREMNGPFWTAVQAWIRLYYHALHADGLIEVSEEHWMAEARNEIARSFIGTKVIEPLMEGIEHISVGAADVGGELGKPALNAKVVAEVGEWIGSKMVGGGGIHVFCNAIDAAILFWTRPLQIGSRMFLWANSMDSSGICNLAKVAFVATSMARAQKYANFEVVENVEIDDEELRELDLEGQNIWRAPWSKVTDGKRAVFVNKLLKKKKKRLRLREARGSLMKRYFFLKARKRGHRNYLGGKTTMDDILSRTNLLTVMAVQENVANRALIGVGDEEASKNPDLALRATPISDEVREGMAAEFSADNEAFVAHLLREVEAIFNPEVSSRQRSFQVKMLENLLAGFVYKSYGAVVNERGEVFGNSFWGIWQQVRLRLRAKKYGTHIYAYADFLRIAALQTDPVALARKKYEAMEALLEIFRHLRRVRPVLDEWHLDIHPFVSEESRLKIKATHAMLEKSYLELRAHRPWKRKRAAYSWKPWGRHAMCRELAEVGQ